MLKQEGGGSVLEFVGIWVNGKRVCVISLIQICSQID